MSLNTLNPFQRAGYFMLDHSATEPLPDEIVMAAGLPAGAGQGLFEADAYTCSHCQAVVVLNKDRKRERGYCKGCDHVICDTCMAAKAAGASCKTFKQMLDEIQSAAEKQADIAPSILLQT
jgi:hypothetical protein